MPIQPLPQTPPDFEGVLRRLHEAQVRCIVIGGLAGIIHGLARVTYDVDVVYQRGRENAARMVEAMKPCQPYMRGVPPGLPFSWDERTIRNGLNFMLTTTLGDVDFLGEVTGGGFYEDILPHSSGHEAFGFRVIVLNLPKLIEVKRAAGRAKDLEVLSELELLLTGAQEDRP